MENIYRRLAVVILAVAGITDVLVAGFPSSVGVLAVERKLYA
jgi:hypothetical protein